MPTRKSPAKKSAATKKPAAKKTTAKKASPRKTAATSTAKAPAGEKPKGTLHTVARSIGSTLGSLAKKTSKAVEAAKQALPGALHDDKNPE